MFCFSWVALKMVPRIHSTGILMNVAVSLGIRDGASNSGFLIWTCKLGGECSPRQISVCTTTPGPFLFYGPEATTQALRLVQKASY